jgi:putative sigma-54 modulation protein
MVPRRRARLALAILNKLPAAVTIAENVDAGFAGTTRFASPGKIEPWQEGAPSVQIKISARHGHLSDENQQFIQEKAEKLLRFFDRLTLIEVTVDMQDGQKVVEFVVQAEHKHDITAQAVAADLMAAVELAEAKLETRLRKYKEKIQDHRRTPSTGEVAGAPAIEENSEE